MATVSKAPKAKPTRGTSAHPALPIAWPVQKSRHEEQQEYFPKVGDDVYVYLNSLPFWQEPSWGPLIDVRVKAIRDLMFEPLSLDEFAQLVTANIGRYWIGCDWTIHYWEEPLRGACQFFWNDCRLESFWDESQADPKTGRCDFQLEPDSPAQPYQRHALQIVARVGQAWVPVATFEADAEGRLAMFAQLRDLVAKSKDTTALGVRPVGC